MGAARLIHRFREILAERTISLDPEYISFAVDMVRLALRALRLVEPTELERRELIEPVQKRTGLDYKALSQLVTLALSPEFGGAVSPVELRAFQARFGATAAALLQEDTADELDLAGFTRRYGSSAALLLLKTLFAVAAADGQIEPEEVARLRRAADDLGVDEVLVSFFLQRYDPRYLSGDKRRPLRGERIVIGRAPSCDLVLADPQVASQHAALVRSGDGWQVVDLGSGRPVLVDGEPRTSAPFTADTQLRLGPFVLRRIEDEIAVFGERSFASLTVRGLHRRIGEVVLLEDVNFTVFSGEVVALVGPSGAGKTTLLNAISGVTPADVGEVLLENQDFHRLLQLNRALVGNVPQDDLVPPELTVAESLFYSGRLRFPRDVTDAEVHEQVARVLDELGIEHIRDSRIGDALQRGISGGQRKRVNLGQELMTRSTRVLFLDEPTSGLDPRASQDIVQLVRRLADRGRIIFLVTHDLSPEVMAQVDHLLVMAKGGRVAYFGPPAEAARWFGVSTPDAIFNRLEAPGTDPRAWAQRYRQGDAYRRYVATREHLLGVSGSPTRALMAGPADATTGGGTPVHRQRASLLGQTATLTSRYLRIKLRDRTGMLVIGLQPPFLAAVMAILFPSPTVEMLFMLSLSALWFGLSASVRELISDRVIWRRERRVGVGVFPYVASKVIVLAALTGLQAVVLAAANYLILGMGGEFAFHLPLLLLSSVLTAWVGMATGLLVSAAWTSSEAAVGTLPLLLIPQIAFSSILLPIRDMGAAAKVCTWLTFQRYTFDAAIKCGDRIARRTRIGDYEPQPISGALYDLGLKFTASADDFGFSLAQLILILVGIIVTMLGSTFAIVWRRDP